MTVISPTFSHKWTNLRFQFVLDKMDFRLDDLKVTLNDMLDDYAEAAKLGKVLYVTLLIHIFDVYIRHRLPSSARSSMSHYSFIYM